MLVRDVMTAPVLSVEPTVSVDDAAKIMLSHRISGLPVVEKDGALVGVVTEGDFLRRGELGTQAKRSRWLEFFVSPGKAAEEYVRANARRVGDVMTTEVATASPGDTLEHAVETMTRHRIKRLPVLDGGKLVGVISRSDLMRALVSSREAATAAQPTDDRTIYSALVAELGRQSWSGNGLIRVHVTNGNVELSGTIFDEREREAARVLAENVPGVVGVEDHLVSVEPISGVIVMPSRAN